MTATVEIFRALKAQSRHGKELLLSASRSLQGTVSHELPFLELQSLDIQPTAPTARLDGELSVRRPTHWRSGVCRGKRLPLAHSSRCQRLSSACRVAVHLCPGCSDVLVVDLAERLSKEQQDYQVVQETASPNRPGDLHANTSATKLTRLSVCPFPIARMLGMSNRGQTGKCVSLECLPRGGKVVHWGSISESIAWRYGSTPARMPLSLWRSSFWPGGPAPQRKCAGLLSTTSRKWKM